MFAALFVLTNGARIHPAYTTCVRTGSATDCPDSLDHDGQSFLESPGFALDLAMDSAALDAELSRRLKALEFLRPGILDKISSHVNWAANCKASLC